MRARFEELGIPTIDADTLAREAVAPGTAGLAQVIRRFGPDICDARGQLDRKRLGAIVFGDPDARRALEAIIHPFVREATERWFASLDPERHRFAVADIPLLFEGGRERDFESIVVAACEPGTQLQRLMHRDNLTEAEGRQRIAAQWPLADKIARADYVIHTDGSFEETNRQVQDVLDRLRA